MTTLTEFLLARLAEDEAAARDAGADAMVGHRWKHWPEDAYNEVQAIVLAHSRGTVADVAAKRRIVEEHRPYDHRGEHGGYIFCTVCQWDHGDDSPRIDMGIDEFGKPCPTLRALASVYADHEDYREEWAL